MYGPCFRDRIEHVSFLEAIEIQVPIVQRVNFEQVLVSEVKGCHDDSFLAWVAFGRVAFVPVSMAQGSALTSFALC